MVEANGEDQNGGVFSFTVVPSLLTCPSEDFKPTLLKKFGDWNEKTELLAKYAPCISSGNGVFLKTGSVVSF